MLKHFEKCYGLYIKKVPRPFIPSGQNWVSLVSPCHIVSSFLVGFHSYSAYQALVLTCADSYVATDTEQGSDGENVANFHAYQDYLIFWYQLFKDKEPGTSEVRTDPFEPIDDDMTEIDDDSIASEGSKLIEPARVADKRQFFVSLYDGIMSATFQFTKNLDLTTTEPNNSSSNHSTLDAQSSSAEKPSRVTTQHMPSSGDISTLRANNPKDFAMLVNLVEFSEILLRKVRYPPNPNICIAEKPKDTDHFFWAWVFPAGRFWIEMSTQYPLVSGFYKMFTVCLDICREITFFHGVLTKKASRVSRMVSDTSYKIYD